MSARFTVILLACGAILLAGAFVLLLERREQHDGGADRGPRR